jgi:hypothetical protein
LAAVPLLSNAAGVFREPQTNQQRGAEEKAWDVGGSPQTYRGSNAETLGGRKEVREKETLTPSISEPGHEKICSRLTSVGLFFCSIFVEDIFIAKS